MHWLVEVSRVGDTVASERYCIDARRWQSALQEARRMRGDAGALPKLTIELLDSGYRAIDPELKVRYLVSEAPPGMPLTDGARAMLSTAPPPVEPVAAGSASRHPAPTPAAGTPAVLVASAAPVAVATAASVSAAPVATPAAAAPATLTAAPPVAKASATPPAAPVPWRPSTLPSPLPPGPLVAQVIRQREEKPSEANPIAYRELALAVKMGAQREDVETLLLTKLEEMRAGLPEGPRRYVQLAVFDHVFVKRPVRPPLGILVWKDWRGEPALSFPGFGDALDSAPPSSLSSSRMPSWSSATMTSLPPKATTVAPSHPAASATPPAAAPSATPAAEKPSAAPTPVTTPSAVPPTASQAPQPAPTTQPASPGSLRPMRVVTIGGTEKPSTSPVEMASTALAEARVPADLLAAESERVAEALRTQTSAPPNPAPATPVVTPPVTPVAEPHAEPSVRRSDPASRRSEPVSARRSDPGLVRRREASEDLIVELFERMHELSFMADLPSGADYVLNVLYDVIPCEAMLVHVFDLGRREFVVVRAHGPSTREALLFRTPDTDPLIAEVMRQRSMSSNGATPLHSGAFAPLGVEAKQVLSGGARQGGRYLGLIELANPFGGTPFHQNERNALEYVCEQFADFVAGRPVVLDADLVLRS